MRKIDFTYLSVNKYYKMNEMNEMNEIEFTLSGYFELLSKKIQHILLRPENNVLTYDILHLFSFKTPKNGVAVQG